MLNEIFADEECQLKSELGCICNEGLILQDDYGEELGRISYETYAISTLYGTRVLINESTTTEGRIVWSTLHNAFLCKYCEDNTLVGFPESTLGTYTVLGEADALAVYNLVIKNFNGSINKKDLSVSVVIETPDKEYIHAEYLGLKAHFAFRPTGSLVPIYACKPLEVIASRLITDVFKSLAPVLTKTEISNFREFIEDECPELHKYMYRILNTIGYRTVRKMTSVTLKCRSCGKRESHTYFEDELQKWRSGVAIQEAMPECSDFKREFLLSDMCYECQSKTFNVPKPGESWGEPLFECDVCGTSIYAKDENVCPCCLTDYK